MNQLSLSEEECDPVSRNLSEMLCSEKLAASPPEYKQWVTSGTLPSQDVVLWIDDSYVYQRQHDDYFHDQFYWKRNLQIKYHTMDYLAIQPHVKHFAFILPVNPIWFNSIYWTHSTQFYSSIFQFLSHSTQFYNSIDPTMSHWMQFNPSSLFVLTAIHSHHIWN